MFVPVDTLTQGDLGEASAIECLGLRPKLVRGHADNIKVTNPEDAGLAEAILRARTRHD